MLKPDTTERRAFISHTVCHRLICKQGTRGALLFSGLAQNKSNNTSLTAPVAAGALYVGYESMDLAATTTFPLVQLDNPQTTVT